MHSLDPSILREYDIRGIIGETLHEADAEAIGRAFGTRIRNGGGSRVCVGWDGRLSSISQAAAVVRGLTSTGCAVHSVGRGPTPMLYFAVRDQSADGGVMVTGSHNPPDHNGFKLVAFDRPFFGADIRGLGDIAATGSYVKGIGSIREVPVLDAYVRRLRRDFTGGRSLKVVWDCGNGATGEVVSALTALLPGEHRILFPDIDGSFPNHHPDPTEPHNLEEIIRVVRQSGADLGIAFDGDGDRIGVIDSEGEILWGDLLLLLFAEQVLTEHPSASVIADVKASKVLFDGIVRLGGRPVMERTGHSLIKTKIAETGAPLAGEMSGHIFFADRYYGFDDALYAAIRLLGILAGREESLADWRRRQPRLIATPEIRIDCADARKFEVIASIRQRLEAAGVPFNGIDGVRVDAADGWWLLRASNTQAVLVARCEAASHEGLMRLLDAVSAELEAHGMAAISGRSY